MSGGGGVTVGAAGQSCLLLSVLVKSVDTSVTTSLTSVDDIFSIMGDRDELITTSALEDSLLCSEEGLYVRFGVVVSTVEVSVVSAGMVDVDISRDIVVILMGSVINISDVMLDSSITVTFSGNRALSSFCFCSPV
jgi:hypothetical protein